MCAPKVINNFAGGLNESVPYANASRAFHLYNAVGNYNTTKSDDYYYTFRCVNIHFEHTFFNSYRGFSYGDTAFFVTDTRRYRSDPATTEANARTMLGGQAAFSPSFLAVRGMRIGR